MDPRFWIAFRLLITTFFLLMATAPLAREVVTIIGSISGVRPTATDIANNTACIQLPFVKPFTKSTTGTMISINRIRIQETALTPFSKVVFGAFSFSFFAMAPITVSFPTEITAALALPLITLLPINARFSTSINALLRAAGEPYFSTGSLSPVSAD